jgi:hypothetical protein
MTEPPETQDLPFYIVVQQGILGEFSPSPAFDERFPTREDAEKAIAQICEQNLFWQGKLEVLPKS